MTAPVQPRKGASGSQPSGAGNFDDLPEYVSRVVRSDLKDLVDVHSEARDIPGGIKHHRCKYLLLHDESEGANYTSPWLHASGTLGASIAWGCMGA